MPILWDDPLSQPTQIPDRLAELSPSPAHEADLSAQFPSHDAGPIQCIRILQSNPDGRWYAISCLTHHWHGRPEMSRALAEGTCCGIAEALRLSRVHAGLASLFNIVCLPPIPPDGAGHRG